MASHHIIQVCQSPLQPRFGSLRLLAFPRTKIASESEEICDCDGHTVHKLSQRCLTADWLVPLESGCSQMHSKVSSDWLQSYINATRPFLEIFKMARYFPDSPVHMTSSQQFAIQIHATQAWFLQAQLLHFRDLVCMTKTCVLIIPLLQHLIVKCQENRMR